jgi:chemotaxis protein MotD
MVGVGIPSAPNGAGSASAAKGTSSSGKSEAHGHGQGGFADLMDKAGDATGAELGDDTGTLQGLGTGSSGLRRQSKAMTELQNGSFSAQMAQDGEEKLAGQQTGVAIQQRVNVAAQSLKGQKPTTKSAETDGSADTKSAKDADGNTKSVKDALSSVSDGKTEATHDRDAASDALSLLHGQAGGDMSAAQVVAAAQQVAAGTQQTSGRHGDSQAEGVRGLKGLAADASRDPSDATASAGESGDADSSSRAFKLARADGRGQALEMSVGKGRDGSTDVDVKGASGTSGADVTVLDQRRYLGLAPGSNASALVGAMSGDSEWSSAMQPSSALSNEASLASTGKVVNTLKLQMNPEDLGTVTATMRLSGDELSVDLKVQSGEAYRQLHADSSAMIDSLRQQGYAVDKITVTLAAPQQSDSSGQSAYQGQQQQQQSMPNQGQGGSQARGQNYAGQQGNANDNGWGQGDAGVEDAGSGGAQRRGSGGVYL